MIVRCTTTVSLMRPKRSTATLTLVLIGAAMLQGCGGEQEETASRDVYSNRADCQRDWGDDGAKCEQVSSGPHAGMFYGPLMYGLGSAMGGRGAGLAPRPGSNAVGRAAIPAPASRGAVSRGGFGSSSSMHGAGG